MATFLFELYSEEIPARMQWRAVEDMERLLGELLKKHALDYEALEVLVTPRRLTAIVSGMPATIPARSEERRGPKEGAPEKAIEGFMKSAGVSRDQLELREQGKARYYFAVIETEEQPVAEMLAGDLAELIRTFPWPKTMRWGAHSIRWVRPLRNICCLLGDTVVPVTYGPITANNLTFGHPVHNPEPIILDSADAYKKVLKKAHVVLSQAERKAQIESELKKAAEAMELRLKHDEGLLLEVAGLAEWPTVLVGQFDTKFLTVPPEVLSTSMRSHQKYFSLVKENGDLSSHFAFVADLAPGKHSDAIVHGNERVLRARLSDAAFFWDQDQRTPLSERLEALEQVTFHAELGSVSAKTQRVKDLAKYLAVWVPHASLTDVEQAATLAKADLATGMVGEFPELQGVMGRYYALKEGLNDEVALAIGEHYAPQGPNDTCPTAPVSVAVAIADKMDSLAGLFAANERPTGSKDPYALRRAALGLIRLILQNGLRIPLKLLIDKSLNLYPSRLFKQPDDEGRKKAKRKDAVAEELLEFIGERLRVMLLKDGFSHDVVTAIYDNGGEDDLVRVVLRAKALRDFLAMESGFHLLSAYRRAANILKAEEKKDETRYHGKVDSGLLSDPAEVALHKAIASQQKPLARQMKDEAFVEAMENLAAMREPVDAFFEAVLVNDPNPDVRRNRLNLLSQLCAAMDAVAKFGRVELEKKAQS